MQVSPDYVWRRRQSYFNACLRLVLASLLMSPFFNKANVRAATLSASILQNRDVVCVVVGFRLAPVPRFLASELFVSGCCLIQ